MEHELVVLLANLLYSRYQETDFSKLIPAIIFNFHDTGLLKEDFLAHWDSAEADATLAEHFLFVKEHNDSLRTAAKSTLDKILRPKESSESGSDSGSESGSED